MNQSLGNTPGVGTYCDPLTWRSDGLTGQQMVGAIERSGPSSQIAGWPVGTVASPALPPSRPLFDLGFECLCPDFAFLGAAANGTGAPLWAAKCTTKCSDTAGHEVGCDVYAIGTTSQSRGRSPSEQQLFQPARALPTGRGAANRFPVLDHGMMTSSAQTLQDPDNGRVLLWQWLPEGDCGNGQQNCSATATGGKLRDWEGVQTLPRVVRASEECHADPALAGCTLLVQAAPEIQRLQTWRRNTSGLAASGSGIAVPVDHGPDALHVVARFGPLGGGRAAVVFEGSTRFNVSLIGGAAPAGVNASSRMMNNTNFGGHNLPDGTSFWPVANASAARCQAACDELAACLMWTFVARARNSSSEAMCCLKGGAIEPPTPEAGCVSGVKDPGTYRLPPSITVGPGWRHSPRSVPMQLRETLSCQLPPALAGTSSHTELDIYVDHSIVEVFTSTGHCAFAVRVYQEAQQPKPQPCNTPPRTIRTVVTGSRGAGGSGHGGGVAATTAASLEVFGMAAAYRDYRPPPVLSAT